MSAAKIAPDSPKPADPGVPSARKRRKIDAIARNDAAKSTEDADFSAAC